MKWTLLRWVSVGLAIVPMAATAQTTVLDYQGQAFTTAAQSLPVDSPQITPTFSVGESISLSITLSAPLGDSLNDVTVSPTQLTINGPSEINFFAPNPGTVFQDSFAFSTNAHGAITGWAFSIVNGPQLGTSTSAIFQVTSQASLGVGQDTAYATYFSPYDGNPFNPPDCCFSSASVNKAGSWTDAPEIDPSLAVGGLTLLLGGLAVMRGSRPTVQRAVL